MGSAISTDDLLLAVECSSDVLSVAVAEGRQLLAERFLRGERSSSALLLPCIEGVLADAGKRKEQLMGVCASVGPGSLTALRIGLATAMGLSLALGIPNYGLNCLQLIANRYRYHEGTIWVLQKTYRKMLHAAQFRCCRGIPVMVSPIREGVAEEILPACAGEALIVGNGLEVLQEQSSPILSAEGVHTAIDTNFPPLHASEVLFHLLQVRPADTPPEPIRACYGGDTEADKNYKKKFNTSNSATEELG